MTAGTATRSSGSSAPLRKNEYGHNQRPAEPGQSDQQRPKLVEVRGKRGVEQNLGPAVSGQRNCLLLGHRTKHRALGDSEIEERDQEGDEHPRDATEQRSDDHTDQRIGHPAH